MTDSYPIPLRETRTELMVENSRFIATIAPAFSVEEARQFIARIKDEFKDATHNVPAFIIGHGASVITHSHDDGEPSGTAGRPALSVLTGSGLGDAVVVVTRYFGGTKLGTGGLVRAYSEAVRQVLQVLPRARRVETHIALIAVPYAWFQRLRQLVADYNGAVVDETFAADVTLTLRFPVDHFQPFQDALREASAGSLQAEIIETREMIVPIDAAKNDSSQP